MKNFMDSITTYGAAVSGALLGLQTAGAIPEGATEVVAQIGQALGLAVAYFGRWRARQPLTVGPSS